MLMRTLLILLLLTGLAHAEQPDEEANPWSGTQPTQLRTLMEEIPEIMERSWYQVEVLVFAREEPANDEHWRLGRYPAYPASNIRLGSEDGGATPLLPEDADSPHRDALEAGAWRKLPDEARKLADAVRSMEQSRFRTLYHETWRQPVLERDQALPIYIEGGRSMPLTLEPETLEQLPGRTRDPEEGQDPPLHDDPATTEERSADDAVAEMETVAPAREILEVLLPAEPELRGTLTLSLARFLHLDPSLWLTLESDQGQRYHVDINQHRRMRSERLHYLDHPLFGVLIRIDPWDHPEQEKKKQLEEALEEHTRRE